MTEDHFNLAVFGPGGLRTTIVREGKESTTRLRRRADTVLTRWQAVEPDTPFRIEPVLTDGRWSRPWP